MDTHRMLGDPLPMAKTRKSKATTKTAGNHKTKEPEERRVFDPLPLKDWFKECGVTQREVAEAIEIDESHLSQIGSGKRDYMRYQMEDMAAFLSQKGMRLITPAMLLIKPGDPDLLRLASEVDPSFKARAALALEAFRRRE